MELSDPPILNSDQLTKCKKEQKSFRFQIELNDEEDYEVSYFDLFERHLVSVLFIVWPLSTSYDSPIYYSYMNIAYHINLSLFFAL